MLRAVSAAVRGIVTRTAASNLRSTTLPTQYSVAPCIKRDFSGLSSVIQNWSNVGNIQQKTSVSQAPVENVRPLALTPMVVPVRSVTKYSMKKGKRKTVKAVIKRFYRLHWGIWIRTKAGRKKHLWRKSEARKRRLKEHVFCNATQSTLLDIMVNKYWRRPRFYVDDPYNPYHKREEFLHTRKKPLPLPE